MGAGRGLAAIGGVCLAAGGAAWLHLTDERRLPPATTPPPAALAALEVPPVAVDRAPPLEPAALARAAELQAMSETYRNTTFLTAIRGAGFVCYELGRVYGGVNDSSTWTVACEDMLAYTVRVGPAGELVVEPTAQYLDGLAPAMPRDERRLRDAPLPLPR